MKNSYCYTNFTIGSNGTMKDHIGFQANENGDFDPKEITRLLT